MSPIAWGGSGASAAAAQRASVHACPTARLPPLIASHSLTECSSLSSTKQNERGCVGDGHARLSACAGVARPLSRLCSRHVLSSDSLAGSAGSLALICLQTLPAVPSPSLSLLQSASLYEILAASL